MKVYEVVISNGMFSSEKWLFTTDTLQVAVEKAQKKLNRAVRLYENFEIISASALRGSLIS